MIKGNEVTQDNKGIFIEYWHFIVEEDRIYLDEIRQAQSQIDLVK